MKTRKWKRRVDGVRQRYWIGRKKKGLKRKYNMPVTFEEISEKDRDFIESQWKTGFEDESPENQQGLMVFDELMYKLNDKKNNPNLSIKQKIIKDKDSKKPLGYVEFEDNRSSSFGKTTSLKDIYIIPNERKKGKGTEVIDEIFKVTGSDVLTGNSLPTATKFWEKKGAYLNPIEVQGKRGMMLEKKFFNMRQPSVEDYEFIRKFETYGRKGEVDIPAKRISGKVSAIVSTPGLTGPVVSHAVDLVDFNMPDTITVGGQKKPTQSDINRMLTKEFN